MTTLTTMLDLVSQALISTPARRHWIASGMSSELVSAHRLALGHAERAGEDTRLHEEALTRCESLRSHSIPLVWDKVVSLRNVDTPVDVADLSSIVHYPREDTPNISDEEYEFRMWAWEYVLRVGKVFKFTKVPPFGSRAELFHLFVCGAELFHLFVCGVNGARSLPYMPTHGGKTDSKRFHCGIGVPFTLNMTCRCAEVKDLRLVGEDWLSASDALTEGRKPH